MIAMVILGLFSIILFYSVGLKQYFSQTMYTLKYVEQKKNQF